ncbi:MAG TPA: asparagine synthase (glutamine-hydrolyzing) [Flavobacteriales bacterium]|nr:asparagine synthase (glutamine-hydrolyzing) [Flavobacteriales bacterium]
MCGINGYIGFKNKDQGLAVVQNMNRCMAHRGPDNTAQWTNDNIALGHVRLSILDLSEAANQPFVSACGNYVIVFNGEIYNFAAVKKTLLTRFPGLVFRTTSDTEILLHAYIKLGEDCLQELNGMFAFAIWDIAQKKMFIARDRIGEKPLYYYSESNVFLFASEIRSLLATGLVPRKLNSEALNDYVQYQTVHAPYTLIQDVYMLMPGNYLTVEDGFVFTKNYWNPKVNEERIPENGGRKTGNSNIISGIKTIFEDSVRLRMVADVEVGAFLSGGIDSSAVVAQMARLSTKPVSTFSVIFGEKDFSEEEFSNQIAHTYKTNHHPIRITADEFLHEIPVILKAVDFPGGDGPNTYAVAKATRKTGIKVAMTGLGGDELFAGYPVFAQTHAFHQKKILKKTPRFVRQMAGAAIGAVKGGTTGQKYRRILAQKKITDAGFYSLSRQLFDKEFVKKLLGLKTNGTLPVEELAKVVFNGQHPHHLLSQVSIAEMRTYMQNVLLRDTDQMTMAHALEVRAPFLDHRLIEFALSVNDKLKYPHTPKQLFVQAMGDLLPPAVVNRKKMGFTFPWAYWLRNEMRTYCEQRIQALAQRGYFNKEMLTGLWEQFIKNDPSVTWSRVWHLVTLEEWLNNNNIE